MISLKIIRTIPWIPSDHEPAASLTPALAPVCLFLNLTPSRAVVSFSSCCCGRAAGQRFCRCAAAVPLRSALSRVKYAAMLLRISGCVAALLLDSDCAASERRNRFSATAPLLSGSSLSGFCALGGSADAAGGGVLQNNARGYESECLCHNRTVQLIPDMPCTSTKNHRNVPAGVLDYAQA